MTGSFGSIIRAASGQPTVLLEAMVAPIEEPPELVEGQLMPGGLPNNGKTSGESSTRKKT